MTVVPEAQEPGRAVPPRGDRARRAGLIVTVLVWNTQGGATSRADVARLIRDVHADVVSVPEMDENAAAEVSRLVGLTGHQMNASTTRVVAGSTSESWIPPSLLVAENLGRYELDAAAGSTPGLPSGVWRPVERDRPVILTVHPMPPLPTGMDDWQAGLAWITEQCATLGADVIVAGDLNATLDHLDLGPCRDTAAEAGAAATGTWPTTLPAWLGSPIDHVVVGPAWSVLDARAISPTDGDGTDHRAFVAVMTAR